MVIFIASFLVDINMYETYPTRKKSDTEPHHASVLTC